MCATEDPSDPNSANEPKLVTNPDPDPFFASDEDIDDDFEDIVIPTVSIKAQRVNRAFDSHQCPIIVIVDTSGIHQLRVRPCRCDLHRSTPMLDQFLLSGLYPASTEKTRTVFTLRVLDDYNLDNLE